jgi:hypothetical protein
MKVDRQLLYSYFMSLVVNVCSKRAEIGSIQQDYKPLAGGLEETLSVRTDLRAKSADDNVTSTAIQLWCNGGQWVFLT